MTLLVSCEEGRGVGGGEGGGGRRGRVWEEGRGVGGGEVHVGM